ncbi:MAG TPA: hypothetical protein VFK08_07375, partial [Rhodanobacteraceae bacterium]|nr:hypothetical protein [Rhodanobacteraceae bacterium]
MSWGSAMTPGRVICALALVLFANAGLAQTSNLRAPPDLLQRVGFDQNLGAQAPLDGRFREADGAGVSLRELLH